MIFYLTFRWSLTTDYSLAALRAAVKQLSPINFRMDRVPLRRLLKSQSDAQR